MAGLDASRFLVRAEDGSEHPVGSLEELSLWVESGEVRPDTPIFDQGTGQWSNASESPQVRFLLDELAKEGVVPEPFRDEGAHPEASAPDSAEGASDADDFGLGTLDLVDFEVPDPEPTPEEPDEPDPEPGPSPDVDLGLEDWMKPKSGDASSAPDASEHTRPPSPPAKTTSPARDDPAPWDEPRTVPSAVASRSRREKSTSSRWMLPLLLVGLAGAGFLLADSWMGEDGVRTDFIRSMTNGGGANGAPAGADPPDVSRPWDMPAPAGFEMERDLVLATISARTRQVIDSLRVELGLPDAPPSGWLSGQYLSAASTFPEVRDFWEGYQRLVEELRVIDRRMYLGAVTTGVPAALGHEGELPNDDVIALQVHLRERYARYAPVRQERYEQLSLAAERAIALHDFLLSEEERIRHTPALGTTVPLDPVLEAGSNDPAVHREMLRHLDELFEALERSRDGGRPSSAGLQVDLFARMAQS